MRFILYLFIAVILKRLGDGYPLLHLGKFCENSTKKSFD